MPNLVLEELPLKLKLPCFGKKRSVKIGEKVESVNFDDFSRLNSDILGEVVREGELRLQTQLAIHLATDQRGFAIAGILLTIATASLAAYFSFDGEPVQAGQDDVLLHFSIGILVAAFLAIAGVAPRKFSLPGNEPKNWAPKGWRRPLSLKGARIEQAEVLQSQIDDNRSTNQLKAYLQISSILLSFINIVYCAIRLAFL